MITKLLSLFFGLALILLFSFQKHSESNLYQNLYSEKTLFFIAKQTQLLEVIKKSDLNSQHDVEEIKKQLFEARAAMKGLDFWFRYLNPVAYKKINGPLPVEWETEAFEKFEKPYKRDGAGLSLALLYLDENSANKDSLIKLVMEGKNATAVYNADSTTQSLKNHHHFFLCNRLFLLNLATIYTTGFDCPDKDKIIPEMLDMMENVKAIYESYNMSFPENQLDGAYLQLYNNCLAFVKSQPKTIELFNHYTFIREFVNPLFAKNQELLKKYHVKSSSYVDYTLNNDAKTIFSKELYWAQNEKGVFARITDPNALAEVDRLGKLLFYDPLLSGNNMRSCGSCHKFNEYLTDTTIRGALQFDRIHFLARNTPSLINTNLNHLLMWDGKHYTLQQQVKAVIENPLEMGAKEAEVMKKIMGCTEYKKAFKKLLKYTPQFEEVSFDHIVSAITFYYSKFSKYEAPFDGAMNKTMEPDTNVIAGFNLFMGKAQCATCHFLPQFNGVKPPYVNSEFEVLGVPADTLYTSLNDDLGRFNINPAKETKNAFRTGSIRNAAHTMPYMHNGVFKSMEQVIEFYDAGGGIGKKLKVENQTLSGDSLHLTALEKKNLIFFIQSLNESIVFEAPPAKLPTSKNKELNHRKVGGEY